RTPDAGPPGHLPGWREERRRRRPAGRRRRGAPRRAAIQLGAVLAAGEVAPRRLEAADELVLAPPAEALRELDRPRGVAQHLHGLDAGQLVEDPPAARLHEERVARELEEPARLERPRRRQRGALLGREPALDPRGREHAVDVPLARAP